VGLVLDAYGATAPAIQRETLLPFVSFRSISCRWCDVKRADQMSANPLPSLASSVHFIAFWFRHPGDNYYLRMGNRCSRDGVLFLEA
jgi:hypothetical protein